MLPLLNCIPSSEPFILHTLSLVCESLELFIPSLLSELLLFFLSTIYAYLMLSAFLMFDKFVLYCDIYLHSCVPCSKLLMMHVVYWRI